MLAHIHVFLRRTFLLCISGLVSGVLVPPVQAFQVADGMALLHQKMPANYCALTFDDGPGPYTVALLDLLAERGVRATFFMLGQNVERRPDLVTRMLTEGHEVANHSYSHPNMRHLNAEAQLLEMKKTRDVLRSLGAEVRYFRPPYGRYSPEITAKAEALGMTIVLWSLDSQDWKRHASRLEGLRSISPSAQSSFSGMRGVLLFHDTHKRTVDDMPDILDALIASGCERFVTVSEYMAKAPREEERRLATQAPNEGRGETPPAPLASPMDAAVAALPDANAVLPEPTAAPANMRTLPAHLVITPDTGATAPERLHPIPQLRSNQNLILPAHKPN